jgi:hypothetical protein
LRGTRDVGSQFEKRLRVRSTRVSSVVAEFEFNDDLDDATPPEGDTNFNSVHLTGEAGRLGAGSYAEMKLNFVVRSDMRLPQGA